MRSMLRPAATPIESSLRPYLTYSHVFGGAPLTPDELVAQLRRIPLADVLAAIARLWRAVERSGLEVQQQREFVRDYFDAGDVARVESASVPNPLLVFHPHQMRVWLRLALTAHRRIPTDDDRRDGEPMSLGRIALACSDLIGMHEQHLRAAHDAGHDVTTLFHDFTVRSHQMARSSDREHVLTRALELMVDLPREVDPVAERRVEDRIRAALGVGLETFIGLSALVSTMCGVRNLSRWTAEDARDEIPQVLSMSGVPDDEKSAFLAIVTQTLAEAMDSAAAVPPDVRRFAYDFEWLDDRPVLRDESGALHVMSASRLFDRALDGLLPLARDRLRAKWGAVATEEIGRLHACAAERYVGRRIARIIGGVGVLHGQVPYKDAAGRKLKLEDVVATYGADGYVLAIEVKARYMRQGQKTGGGSKTLFSEGSQLVDGLATLARVVGRIRSGPCVANGQDLHRFQRVVPLIVAREPFSQTPVFRRVLDAAATAAGLTPDRTTCPTGVLDYDELDTLADLAADGHVGVLLLWQWLTDADARNVSLLTYLAHRRIERPGYIERARARSSTESARLGSIVRLRAP